MLNAVKQAINIVWFKRDLRLLFVLGIAIHDEALNIDSNYLHKLRNALLTKIKEDKDFYT